MNVRRHPAQSAHRLQPGLVALAAAAVVSAVGLLAGGPEPMAGEALLARMAAVAPAASAPAPSAGDRARAPASDAVIETGLDATPAPRKVRKHVRRSRQSLAIPYFSFARS